MKSIKSIAIFFLIIVIAYAGCDGSSTNETSKSKPSSNVSEENVIDRNSTENLSKEISVDESDSSIDDSAPLTYGDPEFNIEYFRPSGNHAIRLGDSGNDVGWLQAALNKAMGANLTVDCSFGHGTESKPISFQSRCGLQADGIAGVSTISALVDILSGNKTMPKEIVIPIATAAQQQNNAAVQRSNDTPPAPVKSETSCYVANTNTKKFHKPSCSSVGKISSENRWDYEGTRSDLINQGYEPCQRCNP